SQRYRSRDEGSVSELIEIRSLAGGLRDAPGILVRVRSAHLLTDLGREGEVRRQGRMLLEGLVIGAVCEGGGSRRCDYGIGRGSDQGLTNTTHLFLLFRQ